MTLPEARGERPHADAAAGALIAATRRLMDAAATTALSSDELWAAADEIEALASRLEVERRSRVRRIPFDATMVERVRRGERWRMFPFNPFGYPLEIAVADGRAHAELLPGALREGPPGLLHGGFAAALLDALLGTMVLVEVAPAYTATLDLQFLHGTDLDEPVTLAGRVLRAEGRKVWAEGWIEQGGRRTTTAAGLFIQGVS